MVEFVDKGQLVGMGDLTAADLMRDDGSRLAQETEARIVPAVASVIAADSTVAVAAAAAAGTAVTNRVRADALLTRGDRQVPVLDDPSSFVIAVESDRVALQVDGAARTHQPGVSLVPESVPFEVASPEGAVALSVDGAGSVHVGDVPVLPSPKWELATGDGRVGFSFDPVSGQVDIPDLTVSRLATTASAHRAVGIAAFGDSMTYSQEGAGTTWPNEFAAAVGIPAVNFGKPAWGSANVAMLAGALFPRATVTGGTIPASGSVGLMLTPTDGWRAAGLSGELRCTVSLAGVTGVLTFSIAGGMWSFARSSAGDAVPVPDGSPVRAVEVDWAQYQGFDLVLQVGRNNVSPASAVVRDVTSFEAVASRRGVRLLTLGVSPVRGDTADLATVVALNSTLAAAASHFFDVSGWLATTSPESAGAVTYAAGHPQARFYSADGVHFNALGYRTLARGVRLFMAGLGWV